MQKIQLSIPEPCQQNWQQMTPTDQGRFCNACAKEVVDFSLMTDTQLLQYFTTLTHDKVCGRALPGQLDRTISKPEHPKKKIFWYWNYMVIFFMFFAKGNTAKAQGGVKPFTEFSPIKPNDIRGEMAGVTGVNKELSRVIKGKVTDTSGNPVPFASIKIKGSNTGVSADVNGAYSIKVNTNSTFMISALDFMNVEVATGTQLIVDIVLEKRNFTDLRGEVVVIAGGMWRRNPDEEYSTTTISKRIAVFEVKEENSGLLLDKAKITITRKADNKTDTAFTDKKGIYKFKDIKEYNSYVAKVEAPGYETNEFVINGNDFTNRKKVWEVLLRRHKVEVELPMTGSNYKSDAEISFSKIQLGGEIKLPVIVDGIISTWDEIKEDDIHDMKMLSSLEATALFGSAGLMGAVLITTRKLKEKSLDTVAVSVNLSSRHVSGRLGGVSIGYKISTYDEAKVKIISLFNDSLKVYPNPVKRSDVFSVSLKLKESGNYKIKITDATGRIFLLKQINATVKMHVEKMQAESKWSSGLYYISIINKNNQLISKSSFVIQ